MKTITMSVTYCRAFPNRGFTLLEVMVALLILSIGLLGLAAMQLTGMRYNTDAYARTQATLYAYDIIDRIRANPTGRTNGDYTVANTAAANAKINAYGLCYTGSCKCDGTACSSTNLALNDLGKWYNAQANALGGLPGADQNNRATISVINPLPGAPGPATVTVTMNWRERDIPFSQTWVVQL